MVQATCSTSAPAAGMQCWRKQLLVLRILEVLPYLFKGDLSNVRTSRTRCGRGSMEYVLAQVVVYE